MTTFITSKFALALSAYSALNVDCTLDTLFNDFEDFHHIIQINLKVPIRNTKEQIHVPSCRCLS